MSLYHVHFHRSWQWAFAKSYITIEYSFLYWREGWFWSSQKTITCPGNQCIQIYGGGWSRDFWCPSFIDRKLIFGPNSSPHSTLGTLKGLQILSELTPSCESVMDLMVTVMVDARRKKTLYLLLRWIVQDFLNIIPKCGQASFAASTPQCLAAAWIFATLKLDHAF